MTIATQIASITAQGNGVTTSWSYQFLIPTTASCVVQIYDETVDPPTTTTLASSAFSVSGIGNSAGGVVTYPLSGSPLSSGQFLTIYRILPIVQDTSIRNQGNFYPNAVENSLDYLTMVCQQLQDQITALEEEAGSVAPVLPENIELVNTLGNLRALVVGANSLVGILGHTTPGDGGAGWFWITTSNPGADNDGTIVHLDTPGYYGVRQMYEGYVTPQMFGAVADGVTDDLPAFDAAMEAIGNVRGGGQLVVPRGSYFLNGELAIIHQILMTGEGGQGSFHGSKLIFPGGAGIHVYHAVEVSPNGGDWSIISNLFISASAKTTNVDGIYISGHGVRVNDCSINGFKRNGIRIVATAPAENANNWYIDNVRITNCDSDGFFCDGADANAGVAILIDASSNGGYGIYDSSFLGNTYLMCHTAANTGGGYKTDNANARCSFLGCYSEGGELSDIIAPSQVVGGFMDALTTASTASYVRGALGFTRINKLQAVETYTAGVTIDSQFSGTAGNGTIINSSKSDVDSAFPFYLKWVSDRIVGDWANVDARRMFEIFPGANCRWIWKRAMDLRRREPTYGVTVSINASEGNEFDITANTTAAFTISNPTNAIDGQRITVTVRNTSGGSLGTITWDTLFKLASFTNPANGNSRSIDFKYNGTNWVEVCRTPADVPN